MRLIVSFVIKFKPMKSLIRSLLLIAGMVLLLKVYLLAASHLPGLSSTTVHSSSDDKKFSEVAMHHQTPVN